MHRAATFGNAADDRYGGLIVITVAAGMTAVGLFLVFVGYPAFTTALIWLLTGILLGSCGYLFLYKSRGHLCIGEKGITFVQSRGKRVLYPWGTVKQIQSIPGWLRVIDRSGHAQISYTYGYNRQTVLLCLIKLALDTSKRRPKVSLFLNTGYNKGWRRHVCKHRQDGYLRAA